MKILFVNSVCGIGSTGRICCDLADQLTAQGHECRIAYGRDGTVPEKYRHYGVRIGSGLSVRLHGIRARLLDDQGCGSRAATMKFLKWAEEFAPDLLWLHNIHGYYLNYPILFDWIRAHPDMQVRWTLHDCWAFTGHCVHFTAVGCDKWKTGCESCPNKKDYPASLLRDNSRANYERKKAAFTGLPHMTLITPSGWLADLVRQSFLGEYPVEVHDNPVDRDIFKPTPGDFRERYGLEDKKIVLGVASTWDERKGLSEFCRLAEMLGRGYRVVLVGLNEKQIRGLPAEMLGIERTNSPEELAEIYTAADVFANLSLEETFGMTTVESLYCGTPAVVYQGTACAEIAERYGGIAVPRGLEHICAAVRTF